MTRSTTRLSMLGLVAAGFAANAVGAGTIETDGAILAPGTAPTTGVVTIDAAASAAELPKVPRRRPLGSIGTFTVPFPSFPPKVLGDAGGAAFRADVSLSLAAGTHLFSTFDVAPGAVVTCEGPVTIRTTGAVTIDGEVRILDRGALRFVCGGDFIVGEDAILRSSADIIEIDARGDVSASDRSRFDGYGGVTLRAHGREGVAGDVRLTGAVLLATSGSHAAQAAGSVVLTDGAAVHTISGDTVLQAFGGDVLLSDSSVDTTTSAPDAIRVEAAGAVVISASGIQATSTADVRIRAFSGGLTLADGTTFGVDVGNFDLGAQGTVAVDGAGRISPNNGRVGLTSFGADVRVAFDGTGTTVGGPNTTVSIVAAGDVEISGDGQVGGFQSDLRIEAHAGDVALRAGAWLFGRGALEVLASGAVALDEAEIRYDSVVLAAESGGIGLTGTRSVTSGNGPLLAVARGHLLVRTPLSSFGDVSLVSRDGTTDVAGETIRTWNPDPISDRSGRVVVESFSGEFGLIDARGAAIRTGDAVDSSGDIVLAVHDGVLSTPDEGFLVTETATARRDLRRPQRSVFEFAGVVDTGSASFAPGPVTLTVGSEEHRLELAGKGRRLTARGDGVRLEVRPDASGSSRARFRLRRTGYVDELLTVDGSSPVAIGLRTAASDAGTLVRPLSGRYRRGGRGEALTVPAIFPTKVRARFADGAVDSLAFEAELSPLGGVPAAAPDVRVTFGSGFTALVPSSAFVAGDGSEFVATDPLPGVRRVVLDYEHSTLAFETTDVELEAPGDPPVAPADGLTTVLGIVIGEDARAIRVRLGRRRGRLVY